MKHEQMDFPFLWGSATPPTKAQVQPNKRKRSNEEVEECVIPFGKHRGARVQGLAETSLGRGYLRWLSTQDLQLHLKRGIEKALSNTPELAMSFDEAREVAVPFGHNQGKTIGDLAENQQGRKDLARLAKWSADKNFKALTEAIEIVIGQYEELEVSN